MNKKGQGIKELLIIGATIFIVILVSVFVLGGIRYGGLEDTCERYQTDYNIKTIFESNNFLNSECYIIMTDGTKVRSRDFNIATIKEPITFKNNINKTEE